ncbi:MAG: histidine kinase [Gemmatimonadaceae bacterium]|nr:histidine kinase [Chitinophagaceae bacterium]
MFNNPYRYLVIALLSVLTFISTILCEVYYYFHIEISWYYALLTISCITFLIWEGNRIIEPLVQKAFSRSNKIRFLICFFLAGSLVTIVSVTLVVYFVGNILHSRELSQNINPLKLNIIYGGLANLFFHLLNTIHFYFNEFRLRHAEAEELRRNNEQAQLQLVKSQINPHFLFNNLNVLSGMVIKDNPEANHFIEEFCKVYRYILNNQEKELVDLNKELDFIEPYLFLLKTRFNGGLQVHIDIPDRYRSMYIVPAALQMLIENAIKHNIVSNSRPLRLTIHANASEEIFVSNNLQVRTDAGPGSKTGLANIIKRYALISSKDVVISNTGLEFKVTLPLLMIN